MSSPDPSVRVGQRVADRVVKVFDAETLRVWEGPSNRWPDAQYPGTYRAVAEDGQEFELLVQKGKSTLRALPAEPTPAEVLADRVGHELMHRLAEIDRSGPARQHQYDQLLTSGGARLVQALAGAITDHAVNRMHVDPVQADPAALAAWSTMDDTLGQTVDEELALESGYTLRRFNHLVADEEITQSFPEYLRDWRKHLDGRLDELVARYNLTATDPDRVQPDQLPGPRSTELSAAAPRPDRSPASTEPQVDSDRRSSRVVIHHNVDHTIAVGAGRPGDDLQRALESAGFRWSGPRQAWTLPASLSVGERGMRVASLQEQFAGTGRGPLRVTAAPAPGSASAQRDAATIRGTTFTADFAAPAREVSPSRGRI